MKRLMALALAIIFMYLVLTGCGETVGGVGRDVSRIGKGIKTIFIKDE